MGWDGWNEIGWDRTGGWYGMKLYDMGWDGWDGIGWDRMG